MIWRLFLIALLLNGCALDFEKLSNSQSNKNDKNVNNITASFWDTSEGWQPINTKTFSDKKVVQ